MDKHGLIEFIDFLNSAPSGTMICDRIKIPAKSSNPATVFMLKEDPTRLRMIPEKMHVEIRSCIRVIDNVSMILLGIQLAKNPDLLYIGWFNYQSGIVKECFDYLIQQDSLYIFVFAGGPVPVRKVYVSNNFQSLFKEYIPLINKVLPWSLEDFERTKHKILNKYPKPASLWCALEKGMGLL